MEKYTRVLSTQVKNVSNLWIPKLFMTWELGNITFHEHFWEMDGHKVVEVSEDNWVLGSFQGNFSILLLENEPYLKQNS